MHYVIPAKAVHAVKRQRYPELLIAFGCRIKSGMTVKGY
jgi:hypothetical protein